MTFYVILRESSDGTSTISDATSTISDAASSISDVTPTISDAILRFYKPAVDFDILATRPEISKNVEKCREMLSFEIF